MDDAPEGAAAEDVNAAEGAGAKDAEGADGGAVAVNDDVGVTVALVGPGRSVPVSADTTIADGGVVAATNGPVTTCGG